MVYVQNFIPSLQHPGNILAEIWTGHQQDVFHLRPFGTTAYAHVPNDLSLSKLFPRSVKVSLLGYYRHNSYKLLERNTSTIFRSHDIIFEERETHYARQPTPMIFIDNTDSFPYQRYNPDSAPDNVNTSSTDTKPSVRPTTQEIAP